MLGVTEHVMQPLSMNIVIQITMIAAAALMIIFCKANPKTAIGGAVWQNGMVAVIVIYGIAWMSDTFSPTTRRRFRPCSQTW